MVVMSMEAYEKKIFEDDLYLKLKEAELEAKTTEERISHHDVMSNIKARIANSGNNVSD